MKGKPRVKQEDVQRVLSALRSGHWIKGRELNLRHGIPPRMIRAVAVYACSNCHGAIDRNNGPYANYFLSNDPAEQELLRKDREWFIERALERMKEAA